MAGLLNSYKNKCKLYYRVIKAIINRSKGEQDEMIKMNKSVNMVHFLEGEETRFCAWQRLAS